MQQYQHYRCPNCQTELGEPLFRCPQCGMQLQDRASEAFTKVPVIDGILGTLAGLILISTGIGFIGAVVAYFRLRSRYPYFCVGLLTSAVLILLLILGIFLVCLSGIPR
ncbi:hypothetical protein [Armatimonas rosea]|uniref:Putative RNA-binding Zn-ribbon protein involved in translation (DUF1610 family) n=1 Tax=Armatimonas rosea TaxID=685828 RepID=A0A7W9W4U7_ARMRO|nr:hypothetical protein [Armatimonas rosea]MBB6049774.1 putative RNA-binding Zn-ribbon protein involved in translation (DUF1610 family) [Armatimonas rosea]